MSFEETQKVLNSMIDSSDNIFEVSNMIAKKSRHLEHICHNSVNTSEAISWAITDKPPEDIENRMYRHAESLRPKTDSMNMLLSYIEDEELKEAVKFSFQKSVDIGTLYFNYGNIVDDETKARVRILTRKFWYERNDSERSMMAEFDEMFGIDDDKTENAVDENESKAVEEEKPTPKKRGRKPKAKKDSEEAKTESDEIVESNEEEQKPKKQTRKRTTKKKVEEVVEESATTEDQKQDVEDDDTTVVPEEQTEEVSEDKATTETDEQETTSDDEAANEENASESGSEESETGTESDDEDEHAKETVETEDTSNEEAKYEPIVQAMFDGTVTMPAIHLYDSPNKGAKNRVYRNVSVHAVQEVDDFIEVTLIKPGYGVALKYLSK